MKHLLVIFALLPALALAGTPLALKYDSQTGATTDIPSSLTKINFPAGFQLQVAGVPIGSSSFSTITGNPADNANLSAALASKAGASLGINQFAGGAGAYRILSVVAADEIDTRILGLTAGNTAQKLYSSGTTRSTTHFAHAVDLTCVSLQTAGNWQGTAISPRHIVTANHINPANGTTITFVAADGTNVSRTLSNSSRIGSTDIQIGLLSSDLPPSIVPARVLYSEQEATLPTGSPLVFVDQAQKIFVGERNTSVESSNSFVIQQAGTSPRSTFWKSGGLVTGDSGGAIGAIIDGVYVAMSEMHTANSSTQLSGDSIARNYAAINSAMTSLGGSYQLTAFKSQVLPAFLIGTQNAPLINSATGAYNLLDSATDSPALTYNSDDAVYTLTAPGQFRTALSLGTITSTGTSADNKGASYGILASDDDSVVLYYDAAADGWSVGDPSTFRIGLGLGSIATVNQGAVTDAMLASAVKPAVAVVAATNLTLSGEQTIDGVTTSGSLVLCTAQSTGANNGPWISGSGSWTRPTWYTTGSATQAPQFLTTFVRLGTAYSGSTWRMTTANVTIGTTATTWVQTPLAMSATSVTGNLPASAFGNVAVADGLSITLTSAATFGINSISGSKISGGTLGATNGSAVTNLNASNLASGTVPTARLGSGTANSTTVLYGDQTYKTISAGLTIGSTAITSGTTGRVLYDNAGTLGEMTTTGSGTVLALATSPTFATGITIGAGSAITSSGVGGALGSNAFTSTAYAASGGNSDITSASGFTGALTSTQNALGAATADALLLKNTTAATSSVQQWSPALHYTAHGWHSNGTPADKTYDLRAYLSTVSSGDPAALGGNGGAFIWDGQFSGGGYSSLATLDFNGTFTAAGNIMATSSVTAGTNVVATQRFSTTSASYLDGRTDGKWIMTNNAGTGFTALQFGGTTSSFPEIKRNATAFNFRLADDSADAPVTMGTAVIGGGTSVKNIRHGTSGAMVLGSVTVTDAGCTANTRYFFSPHALGTISIPGGYYASTRTASTSFVITSSQATETSTIDWMAIEP